MRGGRLRQAAPHFFWRALSNVAFIGPNRIFERRGLCSASY
jgi:hypothetical protein